MSASVEALVDPIGAVVTMVTAVEPTLGQDEVRQVVEQVSGGRAKRRRLATTLAADASVLTSGRSPAPRVVGDLLLALRAAGVARISPPWCAACGRELIVMQLRGQDWYCAPCYARPQPCASCGQQRPVTFRDRHGRPRCSGCPDQDVGDPRRVLVGLITALDPGLSTDAVSTAITSTVSKPAHEHKLMWAIDAARAAHRRRGEGALPHGAAADRRTLRRRRHPHPGARLPTLSTRDRLEQATRRATDLPQLRRPRQRRGLLGLRNGPGTSRPGRSRGPVVSELPGP